MSGHRDHDHPHLHDHADRWAQQHAEKGALREAQLTPATQALLRDAHVKAGDRVLDMACGAGDTTAAATALGAEALGLDASLAMIQIAQERFPKTAFAHGDMLAPPDGPWDAIVCRLGAHHSDPAWLRASLSVLRPGGRIAIAERDGVDQQSRANGMRSLGEWMDLLEAAGFTDVQAKPSGASLDGRIYIISGRRPGRRST